MAKTDFARDYYADLELPPLSDIAEVKKQFRKLALKYHPDRNPGREAEVNSKFQTIQSAHEVLTNTEQKAKYDAKYNRNRATYRYPAASGVRGNPWQNVSAQYPPPPRRGAPTAARPTPTTSSGAQRYASFTAGVPPSPKFPNTEDQKTRFQAWEHMRPSSKPKPGNPASQATGTASGTGQSNANQGNPAQTHPQRTASQRQKAEASFGARKSGFGTRPTMADEVPAESKNYGPKQRVPLYGEIPPKTQADRASVHLDPLSQQMRDAFLDGRQSTPYQTHGGEKTNPFDGANVGRARSVRGRYGNPQCPPTDTASAARQWQRSSSVPDESDNIKQATKEKQAHVSTEDPAKFGFASRAEERYRPRNGQRHSQYGTSASSGGSTSSLDSSQAPSNGAGGSSKPHDPQVYAQPNVSQQFHPYCDPMRTQYPVHSNGRASGGASQPGILNVSNLSPEIIDLLAKASPSGGGEQASPASLNALESKQFDMLRNLVCRGMDSESRARRRREMGTDYGSIRKPTTTTDVNRHKQTNDPDSSSFPFAEKDSTSDHLAPDPSRFTRNSADNINTRFVSDEHAANWEFNAGGGMPDDSFTGKRRSQSGSRVGRRSPMKDRRNAKQTNFTEAEQAAHQADASDQKRSRFDADEWSQKIGPQNFVPLPTQGASVSPTRPPRPVRKAKPVRKTMGTAGMVDEEESGSEETTSGYTDGPAPPGTGSPNAMDIDTPPHPPQPAAGPANGARNIPVEPSRPDWRPGDVNGVKVDATQGVVPPVNPNTAGSEDTEGFLRANLGDFKNVEPFAPATPSGFGSFADLKSTLPFESKPSAKIPLQKAKTKQPKPLSLPTPPVAPALPSAFATANAKPSVQVWDTYRAQFRRYMEDWASFSGRFVEHFNFRRRQVDQDARNGFPWLDVQGDDGIQQYAKWLAEDREVRLAWTVACDEHEVRVRDFMAFRNRVKGL